MAKYILSNGSFLGLYGAKNQLNRFLECGSLLPLSLPASLLAGKRRLYRGRNTASKLAWLKAARRGGPHSKALRVTNIFQAIAGEERGSLPALR
jgi:hypothetical protein